VDILFESSAAAENYNNHRRLVRVHNLQRANLIRRRLDDLRAAPTLEAMRHLPGRCHELKGNRALQLSIDLDGPYRLIFRPSDPCPKRSDGGLDWTKVTAVVIKEVVNTHE
jgi:plasmid maintenance system killer protein